MINKKIRVKLERYGKEVFALKSCEENSKYLGKVFIVKNDKKYAIIYKNVIQAISGPPGEFYELVDCGKLEGNLENLLKKKAEGIRKRRENDFKKY